MSQETQDESIYIKRIDFNNADYIVISDDFLQWCYSGEYHDTRHNERLAMDVEVDGNRYSNGVIDKFSITEIKILYDSDEDLEDDTRWRIVICTPGGYNIFNTGNEREARGLYNELIFWKYGFIIEDSRFPSQLNKNPLSQTQTELLS